MPTNHQKAMNSPCILTVSYAMILAKICLMSRSQFVTYDADGNTIGSCIDNNSGLNVGGTWKYHAMCMNPGDVDHYEVKDVTGMREFQAIKIS